MWTEDDRVVVTIEGRRALAARRKDNEEEPKRTIPVLCWGLPIAEAVSDFLEGEAVDKRQDGKGE